MRTKNIVYGIVFLILMQSVDAQAAWDTTAAKYYPLNIGNVYVYDYYSLWFNCTPFMFNRKYRVVIEDYVQQQNGKKYYQFSGWWQGGSIWKYQRIDSNTMNVYGYDSMSNTEVLLDSLLVNSGNSFKSSRFNRQTPNASCQSIFIGTVFGTPRNIKALNSYFISIGHGYSLSEGIGFLGVSSCEIGSGPSYSLKGCTIDGIVYGDTLLTGIQTVNSSIPEKFPLSQNYPNPFNPNTIINYSIQSNVRGQTSDVKLVIYNNLGKEVITLVNEKQNPGSYVVDFNGEGLPSGVYFYKLKADYFTETKRMILLK